VKELMNLYKLVYTQLFILHIIITCVCISMFAVYRVAIPVVTKIMSYTISQIMMKCSNITSSAVHSNSTTSTISYPLHLCLKKAMTSTIFMMLFIQGLKVVTVTFDCMASTFSFLYMTTI